MIAFKLNSKSGVPIYRQIQDQIRFGIAGGSLGAGEQLPTVRALAVELSVNPNTVIKAYTELERSGVLTTEQGTGTFVAPDTRLPVSELERQSKLEALCTEFLAEAARFQFTPEEILRSISHLTSKESSHETLP